MFGNHKRKLQDDKESLVPHGLIWHATAEPTPEEVAKSEEGLGYTVNYAQEIERVRRQQSEQPVQQAPDVASQEPSAAPALVPWWRVERPEAPVERPISKLVPMPLSAYVPTPIEPAVECAGSHRVPPIQTRPTPVQPVENQRVAATPVSAKPIQARSTAAPEAPPAQILQASAPQVEGSLAIAPQIHLAPAPQPVAYNPPTLKPQIDDRLVPKSSEISEAFSLAFSRLRTAGKSAWLSVGSICCKALERVGQTVRSLEFGEGMARVAKRSRNLIQGGVARTTRYARTTGSALGSFSRGGVSLAQQMSARVRRDSVAATGDVIRPASPRPSTPSRIRVLLAGSALQAKIITARQFSAWRIRRERAAIDSRFWSSMTLSVIAAIIALVIVSLVPHYAAKSLPSRILNTNPSVDANVSAQSAIAPVPAQKTAPPSRKTASATSTQTTAAKTDSPKADSTKSAMNAKPKHVVHDDYVAPNTYKYYGTGSKSSR